MGLNYLLLAKKQPVPEFLPIIVSSYLVRTSGLDIVGAASSRDRFNSRLNLRQAQVSKPLPQVSFLVIRDLPDKRIIVLNKDTIKLNLVIQTGCVACGCFKSLTPADVRPTSMTNSD